MNVRLPDIVGGNRLDEGNEFIDIRPCLGNDLIAKARVFLNCRPMFGAWEMSVNSKRVDA